MRPGLWRRAGLFGEVAGLDYGAAMIFAPKGCDADEYAHFLACAEAGLMQAVDEARKKPDGE
jgi:hypothetical protein